VTPYTRGASKSAMALALSAGLFVLWLVGMTQGVVPWMTWWNFVFACAFLFLAIYSRAERRPIRALRTEIGAPERTITPSEMDRERRKSA
jgi:ABC-type transport system involved in cytochrome c biogenesis permease subunit